MTQPTVSNHILELEHELNCKLFNRLGKKITPTKEAEVLYARSLEIMQKADDIKESIREMKNNLTGKVIVGASTIPGGYLLPRMMAEFQKKYSSLSFQIIIADSRNIIESVLKHELLLGIVGTKIINDSLQYIPFVEDELVVVSSPSRQNNSIMTFGEAVKMPLVIREEGSGTWGETQKFLKSKGIQYDSLQIAGIFSSTDAAKQAVKAGIGVSILSKFSVMDELNRNILREIKLTDITMKRQFYVIIHKKRTLPHLYTIFLKHILNESNISMEAYEKKLL